jgi:amino acid transporter
LNQAGVRLPWELYSAVAVSAVTVLGYRSIDIASKVLAVLITAEIGILLLLDLGVLAHKGAAALPATPFAPHTVRFSQRIGGWLLSGAR